MAKLEKGATKIDPNQGKIHCCGYSMAENLKSECKYCPRKNLKTPDKFLISAKSKTQFSKNKLNKLENPSLGIEENFFWWRDNYILALVESKSIIVRDYI